MTNTLCFGKRLLLAVLLIVLVCSIGEITNGVIGNGYIVNSMDDFEPWMEQHPNW